MSRFRTEDLIVNGAIVFLGGLVAVMKAAEALNAWVKRGHAS